MSRLLASPLPIEVDEEGVVPQRVRISGRGVRAAQVVYARWRVDADWWRAPISREYWKLGLGGGSGPDADEPDLVCEIYRERGDWRLSRLYD